MLKPKILVTTAAGKTGFATAMQLLEAGYPIRAFVHRRSCHAIQLEKLEPNYLSVIWQTLPI